MTEKARPKHPHVPVRPAGFALALAFAALLCLWAGPALAAGGENVGHVTRIQGQAKAGQGQEQRELALNAPVRGGDIIRTGAGARLELTMLDQTKLTLGAEATFVLERYDLGRQKGPGAVLARLTRGAFKAATGDLSALRGGPFEVNTPHGVIGIRGTEFWGGFLGDGGEVGVLLISGKGVYIKNDAGVSEIVKPLEGVTMRSWDEPPPSPALWSPARRAAAFKTVAFD